MYIRQPFEMAPGFIWRSLLLPPPELFQLFLPYPYNTPPLLLLVVLLELIKLLLLLFLLFSTDFFVVSYVATIRMNTIHQLVYPGVHIVDGKISVFNM